MTHLGCRLVICQSLPRENGMLSAKTASLQSQTCSTLFVVALRPGAGRIGYDNDGLPAYLPAYGLVNLPSPARMIP